MATEEKPAPANPMAPLYLLLLIIGGCLFALYYQGNLGKLDAKSLLLPPPTETQTTQQTSNNQSGTTYAEHDLQQNAYTMDPNPIDTTNPNTK